MKRDNSASPTTANPWDWDELLDHARTVTSRILFSVPAAEDAAQEAIIRAWKHRAQCREVSSRKPWVAQIARREAVRLLQDQSAWETLPDAGLPVEPPYAHVDMRADLEKALAELSPEQQLLIALRYTKDLSSVSIAELLDRDRATVRVQIYRARKTLEVLLRGYAAA